MKTLLRTSIALGAMFIIGATTTGSSVQARSSFNFSLNLGPVAPYQVYTPYPSYPVYREYYSYPQPVYGPVYHEYYSAPTTVFEYYQGPVYPRQAYRHYYRY